MKRGQCLLFTNMGQMCTDIRVKQYSRMYIEMKYWLYHERKELEPSIYLLQSVMINPSLGIKIEATSKDSVVGNSGG